MSNPSNRFDLLINIDGASAGNPGDAAIGVVIRRPDGTLAETVSRYIGTATNNFAEYTALIVGLEKAAALGGQRIQVKSDSELLVRQISGRYKVKSENLRSLKEKAAALIRGFEFAAVEHVRREFNSEADNLAKKAVKEYRRANRMVAPETGEESPSSTGQRSG